MSRTSDLIAKLKSMLPECRGGKRIVISDGSRYDVFGLIELVKTPWGYRYALREVFPCFLGESTFFLPDKEMDKLVVAATVMLLKVTKPHPYTTKPLRKGETADTLRPLSFHFLTMNNAPLSLYSKR